MSALVLKFVVFTSGAVVMSLELGAARMFAPFLGSSIHTWTSLIGAILAALSIGYWWGGGLADRKPDRRVLSLILLAAGGLISLVSIFEYPILSSLSRSNLDLRLLTLIGTIILFAAPAVLLGAVTPFAVKLSLTNLGSSGRDVGALYACSTIGSIFGTFVTGYFLFSLIGTSQLMFLLAAIVGVLSILVAADAKLAPKIALLLLIAITSYSQQRFAEALSKSGLIALDTAYHRILILDGQDANKRPTRSLVTDPLGSQSSMYRDAPAELASDYSKFYDLGMLLVPGAKRVLLIGGGAYSYPKHFIERFPGVQLDVVELDPGMTKIAKQFFQFKESEQISIFHEDARTFIHHSTELYDVILIDAFASSPSIPFQLVTRECFARLAQQLKPGGVVMTNVIGAIDGAPGQFFRALKRTTEEQFAHSVVFTVDQQHDAALPQNLVLLSARTAPDFTAIAGEVAPLLLQRWSKPIAADMPVLVDNFAPVEGYLQPVVRALQLKEADSSRSQSKERPTDA